jgi:hypothetical protein
MSFVIVAVSHVWRSVQHSLHGLFRDWSSMFMNVTNGTAWLSLLSALLCSCSEHVFHAKGEVGLTVMMQMVTCIAIDALAAAGEFER